MKNFANSIVILTVLSVAAQAFAQEPKPKRPPTWEEKKAARFKPITDQQQQLIAKAVPGKATITPKHDRRVLVFYRCEGFIHTSIPIANLAVQEMGRKTGAFKVDLADTYDVFDAGNLKKYDCLIFNNTTHLKFRDPKQEQALLDFVASGKGFAGFHAASDNFNAHPNCCEMVGGRFNGHPWGAGGNWAFKLDDPGHALNRAFNGSGFWHQDEIYQYRPDSYQGPEVLRVLVSLDMTKKAVTDPLKNPRNERYQKDYGTGPREVAVSWVREYEKGRVFYTNFGHREDTYWDPMILAHMLDGVQYAIGDLEADALPTAKAPAKSPALAPEKSK